MIVEARADRPALERLLRLYWAPVYAVIRRHGYGQHDASDLTQDFLTTVVLERNLLGKADPERGRFRGFLRHALKNFLIDRHRVSRGRLRGHLELTGQSADGPTLDDLPARPEAELDRLFDRQWASAIIERALAELEDGLRADGMANHWAAFDANVASPTLRNTRPITLETLAARLGMAGPEAVSNLIHTAKRRFRKVLRDIVAETVQTPGDVDDELLELKRLIEQSQRV